MMVAAPRGAGSFTVPPPAQAPTLTRSSSEVNGWHVAFAFLGGIAGAWLVVQLVFVLASSLGFFPGRVMLAVLIGYPVAVLVAAAVIHRAGHRGVAIGLYASGGCLFLLGSICGVLLAPFWFS